MSASWAMVLRRDQGPRLAALRLLPDIECCEVEDVLWIRGPTGLEGHLGLATLPYRDRYDIWTDGRVASPGALLPAGRLPAGTWRPLTEWIQAVFPVPARSVSHVQPTPMGVLRGGPSRDPGLLITAFAAWQDYAAQAPEIRLRPLMFAVSSDGRALVMGEPLPPLRGRMFAVQHGVAVPCGCRLDPPVDADVVARICELGPGDIALFDEHGLVVVPATDLVAASRSAVRLSPGTPIHA